MRCDEREEASVSAKQRNILKVQENTSIGCIHDYNEPERSDQIRSQSHVFAYTVTNICIYMYI